MARADMEAAISAEAEARAQGMKPAEEWCKDKNMEVRDPDGWRDAGVDWDALISESDFDKYAQGSTIYWPSKA